MNRVIRWTTSLGLAALLIGGIGISAAHADDWHDERRAEIRHDRENIRRDEARLTDLQIRHDEARHNHDWDAMHHFDREIDHVKERLAQERRDLRHDEEHWHYGP